MKNIRFIRFFKRNLGFFITSSSSSGSSGKAVGVGAGVGVGVGVGLRVGGVRMPRRRRGSSTE